MRLKLNTFLWDKMAGSYDRRFRSMYQPIFNHLQDTFKPDEEVLEVGCGSGLVSFQIIPQVKRFVGIDISPKMIKIANSKLDQTNYTNAQFMLNNKLDQHQNKLFDKVVLVNVLHVVDHPKDLLGEIKKYIKPSGEVVLISFCHGEVRGLRYRFLSTLMHFVSVIGLMEQLHRYRFEDIEGLVREAGFDIISRTKSTSGFPFILLHLVKVIQTQKQITTMN